MSNVDPSLPAPDELDAEHKLQVGLFSALQDVIAKRGSRGEVEAVLHQLVEFTNAHFLSEQLMMRLYSYPHYEAHVQEHDRLIAQVRALEASYRAGELEAVSELADRIKTWLLGHLERSDRALDAYLRGHRPGEPPDP